MRNKYQCPNFIIKQAVYLLLTRLAMPVDFCFPPREELYRELYQRPILGSKFSLETVLLSLFQFSV